MTNTLSMALIPTRTKNSPFLLLLDILVSMWKKRRKMQLQGNQIWMPILIDPQTMEAKTRKFPLIWATILMTRLGRTNYRDILARVIKWHTPQDCIFSRSFLSRILIRKNQNPIRLSLKSCRKSRIKLTNIRCTSSLITNRT